LNYLRRDAAALRIGALTTHRAIETATAAEIVGRFGVLTRAASWIGHYPIRTRGTIGGSLAHADATAEWCLLAVLLDAQIVVESTRGRRTIAAGDFFFGFLTTALAPDEMIVEVVFPTSAPHAALTEFAQRKGDFAIVAAAVSLDVTGGCCRSGRVALGGVDAVPVRIPAAEAVLSGGGLGGELFAACADAAAAAIEPGSDAHGSAQYRRKLARTLVMRACQEAMAG
jgi:aerobic carbon-monoxide dehydrogenase medium subunit